MIAIPANEVHVWFVDLDVSEHCCAQLESLLSPYERSRAARFRFRRDCLRFIATRGRLREILSGYEATSPESLQFVCNAYGKPFLQGASRLRFNLSHSESLAAIAIAKDREVGIDIEARKPELATDEVSEISFSPAELQCLREHPEPLRAHEFFKYWTLKEAYIKAIGLGLSYELHDFDVTPEFGRPNALLRDRRDSRAAHSWTLSPIGAPAPFAAALCYSGSPSPVVLKGLVEVVPPCARVLSETA